MHGSAYRLRHKVLVVTLAALVVGCSGGGSSTVPSAPPQTTPPAPPVPPAPQPPAPPSPAPPQPTLVFGTVAIGSPLTDRDVTLWDKSGASTTSKTDADGHYSISTFAPPPYLIEVSGNRTYPTLFSISTKGGLANVTPLTTLLLARLLGKKIDNTLVGDLPAPSDDQLSAARDEVVAYLLTRPSKFDGHFTAPIDVSEVADFISTPFTAAAGDAYDDALARLGQSLMDAETIQGVEEHMLFAADPPADFMSLFPLEFQANCTGDVNPIFSLPNGLVQVSLKSNGEIAIGPYAYTLKPGDQISLFTGWGSPADSWILNLVGNTVLVPGLGPLNDQIQIASQGRRLSLSMFVIRSVQDRGFAQCISVPEIPFTRPSALAQARLLDSTLSGIGPSTGISPPFFCSTSGDIPGVPGVTSGSNILFFDPNGAVHVNSYFNGYALHVPSMALNVRTELVSGASGMRAVLTGFDGQRVFTQGTGFDYDEITVSMGNAGIGFIFLFKGRGQDQFEDLCPP